VRYRWDTGEIQAGYPKNICQGRAEVGHVLGGESLLSCPLPRPSYFPFLLIPIHVQILPPIIYISIIYLYMYIYMPILPTQAHRARLILLAHGARLVASLGGGS